MIWQRTNQGPTVRNFSGFVYELDIEKCFDKIDHLDLIKRIELPGNYRHTLFKTLKAGVRVSFNNYESTEQGTPQGGVISPLLANLSLNGVETLGQCVRYADDMVYILRKGEDVERLKASIDSFLTIRGLNVKASKTRVVDMKGGFDFLGLNFFLKPNGVSASKPKRGWLEETKKKIRDLIKPSELPKRKLRQKIFRILDAKRRFYQYSDLSKVREEWWKLSQYLYGKLGMKIPSLEYRVNRHINVRGEKSPYDADWPYWIQRNNRRYTGNIYAKVFRYQGGKCGLCGLFITETMEMHLHHKDHNHANCKLSNLQLVHRACHIIHHRTVKGKQPHL